MVWSMFLPGAGFVLAALYKAKRGWRLADMRKGASAEERVGQVIEYALTSERGAVAHHVEDIAVSATLTTWWQRRAGSG